MNSYTAIIVYADDESKGPQMVSMTGTSHLIGPLTGSFDGKIAPHLFAYSIQGYSRNSIVDRIRDMEGVTILARIEYEGYIVEKTYESTEYKGEIVRE